MDLVFTVILGIQVNTEIKDNDIRISAIRWRESESFDDQSYVHQR